MAAGESDHPLVEQLLHLSKRVRWSKQKKQERRDQSHARLRRRQHISVPAILANDIRAQGVRLGGCLPRLAIYNLDFGNLEENYSNFVPRGAAGRLLVHIGQTGDGLAARCEELHAGTVVVFVVDAAASVGSLDYIEAVAVAPAPGSIGAVAATGRPGAFVLLAFAEGGGLVVPAFHSAPVADVAGEKRRLADGGQIVPY